MPEPIADALQAVSLKCLLQTKQLHPLRVRRHGVLLVLESGPDDDAVAHVRFRRLGAHIWRIEMPAHAGGWEATPYRGQIEQLLDLLISTFPWTLAALP